MTGPSRFAASAPASPPRVVAYLPTRIPSLVIGLLTPLSRLAESGAIRLAATASLRHLHLQDFDILCICRGVKPADMSSLARIKRSGKKLVTDIDDNLFDIDFATDVGRSFRHPKNIYTLQRQLEMSDAIHVYNRFMKQKVERYNDNVIMFGGYFDVAALADVKPARDDAKIRIAYPTSRLADDTLSDIFASALRRYMDRAKVEVEVYVWGGIPQPLRGIRNVVVLPPNWDYAEFVRDFYRAGFDIGLAPMHDDAFHAGKTDNKYREYGGCGIAGIYSRHDPYLDCVRHGETGLLVANREEEWLAALEQLAENPELRRRISSRARSDVERCYSLDVFCDEWRKLIERARASNKPCQPVPVRAVRVAVATQTDAAMVRYKSLMTSARILDRELSRAEPDLADILFCDHAHQALQQEGALPPAIDLACAPTGPEIETLRARAAHVIVSTPHQDEHRPGLLEIESLPPGKDIGDHLRDEAICSEDSPVLSWARLIDRLSELPAKAPSRRSPSTAFWNKAAHRCLLMINRMRSLFLHIPSRRAWKILSKRLADRVWLWQLNQKLRAHAKNRPLRDMV
ncbi:MAG: glycosyltransferase [Pseudomonadota bacterium]